MKINKNLTPYNRWEGRRGDRVEWIVLHYTANTWQPDLAENEAKAFAAEYVGASAHFFVDQKSVWQSVAVDDTAWHCGDAPSKNGCRNTNSVGIEMCVSYKDGVYSIPAATVKRTAALVGELLKAFPEAKLCRHYDVTGKRCPEPWVREPTLWEDFLKKAEEERPMTKKEREEFDALAARVKELCGQGRIDAVDDCPGWMRPTVEKLVGKGYLKGGKNGALGLTEEMGRLLVISDRAGAFGV